MAGQVFVTQYANQQVTPAGFIVDVQFVAQDTALGIRVSDTIPSVVLTGSPINWRTQIVNAVIAFVLASGITVTAANVNIPSYTTG